MAKEYGSTKKLKCLSYTAFQVWECHNVYETHYILKLFKLFKGTVTIFVVVQNNNKWLSTCKFVSIK